MNSICISNVAIRQTSNNLYNLNDLHKASGGEKRFQPANWLRNAQTVDLIDFLKNEELQSEGKIIQSKQGLGTFVCKELVYAYATWISAKFFLLVIRTFDAVVTGRLKTESRTTSDERTALRQAVSALVGLRRVDYSTAYNMVHQRFGVEKIEDLPRETLPDAVRYVHALTLDNALTGEVLEKIDRPSEKQFSADEIHAIGVCAKYLADCSAFLYPLSDSLRGLGSRFSGRAFSLAQEPHFWLDTVQRALARVNGSAVRGL